MVQEYFVHGLNAVSCLMVACLSIAFSGALTAQESMQGDNGSIGAESIVSPKVASQEKDVDEAWLDRLRSTDPKIRIPAIQALKERVPDSIPVLVKALRDEDPIVRRIGAETIERIYSPLPKTTYENPEGAWNNRRRWEWEWEDWNCSGKLYMVIPALSDALEDDSEEVRFYSVYTLFKLGVLAEDALDGLKVACDDSSPVVRYWANAAVERVSARRWATLRLLADTLQGEERGEKQAKERITQEEWDTLIERVQSGAGWEFDGTRYQTENPYGTGPRYAWPEEPDERWDAALEILYYCFDDLIAAAEGEDQEAAADAAEVLDLLEWALDNRLWVLLRFIDEQWDPCYEPAEDELIRLGMVAFPALEYDYLRTYRFPIGPDVYTELISIVKKQRVAAMTIIARGFDHWRGHEIYNAAETIQSMGPDGLPAIPLILSQWRHDVTDKAPYYDLFWDGYGNNWSRVDCSLILANMGEGALPWLERALEDIQYIVRLRACRNIGGMGEVGLPLLSALEARLDDEVLLVRREAAKAIFSITEEDDARRDRAKKVFQEMRRK